MKPIKLSLALSLPMALAAVAAPASAAPEMHREPLHQAAYVNHGNGGIARSIRADIARLDRQIDRAVAMRRLSGHEAFGLRRDVDRLQYQFVGFMRGGLTGREARTMQFRIDKVERDLARQMHNFDGHFGTGGRDHEDWHDRDAPRERESGNIRGDYRR